MTMITVDNLSMKSTTVEPASSPSHALNAGLLTRCGTCKEEGADKVNLVPIFNNSGFSHWFPPILILKTGLCLVSHTSTVASARATASCGVTGLSRVNVQKLMKEQAMTVFHLGHDRKR